VRLAIALVALLLIASCSRWDLPIEIPVLATLNGQPVDCNSAGVSLTDLRFYVSDLQLIDTDGRAHDVRYATEFDWQNDAVALIDLENGEGRCQNGTAAVYDRLLGVARTGDYRGLRFTVGVPFRLNHANPLTATPPLDDPDMHWHWRSGYKFLRAGVSNGTDGFWIHGGSTGCEGTVGHITECRFPNRFEVFLPDFVPGEHAITFDMGALVSDINLEDAIQSDCSSGLAETACIAPFAALGVDFLTGRLDGSQRVFGIR
jgi:uncharacterized repeat protein (TIGR04052 family)